MPHSNLTRDEAEARAGVVSGLRYAVDLDLTGGSETFDVTTTIRFRAASATATFVDLVATAVHDITLNGRAVDVAGAWDVDVCRVRLDALRAGENEVVLRSTSVYEHTGVGLHWFTDPVDGEPYLHTQFEPFDAHRVFPCFDQPDLKATFAFSVTAPESWEVVSNTAATSRDGGRWVFAETAVMSTYITAIVAGPYHVVRDSHDGIDLGIYCRKSLAQYLDPGEILQITKDGFDFFQRVFEYRYPFGKYDQLFVPEFNAGAMENAGCVTIAEAYVFRSKVTEAERERRAETILHEMAHMWFGDLVTMKWWDDLWLNESFATYMSFHALIEATRFTGAWSTFSNGWKTWAYRQDQLPSTHPIVADIPDIDAVKVNFDGITYAKGAAVLRQLVAWVGEGAFLKGVASYFRRHEWGNTTLADFLGALEEASGRDLDPWSSEWLEKAGVDTLRPSFTAASGANGETEFASFAIEQSAPAAWPTLRSHRVGVGLFERDGERLVRRERLELDVVGPSTDVPQLAGRRVPDLVLVNDGDLAYAKIRLDDRSLDTLTSSLGSIDDELARSLCWSAAWDMLRDGELPARRYLPMVLANIGGEDQISVVQSLLRQAASAAVVFGDPARRDDALASLADTTHRLLHAAPAGSDLQLAFAKAFAGAARSDRDLGALRRLLDGSLVIDGLAVDTDLRWTLVKALAAAGADDASTLIDDELARDATDAGARHAASARASIPSAEAKRGAWASIVDDTALPLATMEATMAGFQQPDQEALLQPYVEPYFEALGRMWSDRVPEVALSFAEAMYPAAVATPELVEATNARLDGLPGPIRRLLLEGRDQVERVQRTRACDRETTD
jgi:aminopeptidase N